MVLASGGLKQEEFFFRNFLFLFRPKRNMVRALQAPTTLQPTYHALTCLDDETIKIDLAIEKNEHLLNNNLSV